MMSLSLNRANYVRQIAFTFRIQESITRSVHTNCTLESIFIFVIYICGGSLISSENTLMSAIIEMLSCGLHVAYNKRGPQLSYDRLLQKHPRKPP